MRVGLMDLALALLIQRSRRSVGLGAKAGSIPAWGTFFLWSKTMDNGPAVVMLGNLTEGYKPVGPFDSWDAASEWADERGLSVLDSWITGLVRPEALEGLSIDQMINFQK